MSYQTKDLRLMGGVPGQQIFLYRTDDAKATVAASGYFNDAVEEYNLSVGDIIHVVYAQATARKLTSFVVAAVTSGVATVTETDLA